MKNDGPRSDFDATDFIVGFIAEAEDHLASANTHLLAIEDAAGRRQPTPRQVRELFRSLHTIKGLAAMVGVEPVVEIAHAMETVLREADRAAGLLPAGGVEVMLKGVRAIEQRVRALAKNRPVPAAPAALLDSLTALRPTATQQVASGATVSLPADLWSRLSVAEREQLIQGMEAGRRALRIDFFPTPSRAAAGINITAVRERVSKIAEIVKVIPQSVPVSETAPGGLAFALILLCDVADDDVALAASTDPALVSTLTLSEPAVDDAAIELGVTDDDLFTDTDIGQGVVRVEVSRLDDALEKLSALVVTQFRLGRALAAVRDRGLDVRELSQVVIDNGRQLRDLRASIMRARTVSVAEILERVPLIVRGLSQVTGKAVRLEMATGNAELDKAVADRVFPAIVHLVRNSVDHALESAEERRAAGKPEVGLVTVTCFERSNNELELTVTDDGRGVDRAQVAKRAGGPVPETDEELLALLTRPGLSTKAEITTTSGRGMGMDVVKRIAVDVLRGELSMRTTAGQGTTFSLRIPLSITIVDAFSFACGGETFVVPVAMVEEIVELEGNKLVRGPDRRKSPRGGEDRRRGGSAAMLQRRGEAVPVLRLDEVFGLPPGAHLREKVIIVRRHGAPCGFAVDRMLGHQEIVVRPLEDPLVKVDGVSGTTDLGDGRPTLVLDLASLGGKLAAEQLPRSAAPLLAAVPPATAST